MRDLHKQIDSLLGQKIKHRRAHLALSQAELGKLLGVSAQQVQRYESGENTLSITKMLQLAALLNVKPDYFLDGLPEEQPAPSETICRALARPLRIMLVDDDANDVILFEKALAQSDRDVDVVTIAKPEEVMRRLHSTALPRPDLIILDINLPRVNGIELLKQLKQSEYKAIPVVMLTNSVRSKEMQACYEAQASGFIQKNTDLHQYYRDVEQILSYWFDTAILPAA